MEAGEYEKIIVKRRDKVVGEFHNPFKKQDGRVRLGMFEGQMSKEQLDWLTSKESDEMVIEMFEESINKDEDW